MKRKEKKPLLYQIRHRKYGLFLGEAMGLGFWSNLGDSGGRDPQMFPIASQAEETIRMLTTRKVGDLFLRKVDMIVEKVE